MAKLEEKIGGSGSCKRITTILVFLGAMLLVSIVGRSVYAFHTCGATPLAIQLNCGAKSGLVPFHKDAIHSTLVWSKSDCPKMLIWMRPSEWKPSQFLAPPMGGGVTPNGLQFPGFNPIFVNLVMGGNALSGLDQSGWTYYPPDLEKENSQLIDVCGLQAAIDSGIFTKQTIPALTLADMPLTDPFFQDAGYSKGMNQNLFCAGNVSGTDGRIYVIGGHDKGGDNGIRKVSIYDGNTELWVPRTVPPVKLQFEADPTGTLFVHANPLDENNTDPPDPSDYKYQRWYGGGNILPNGLVFAWGATDQDTSVGPALTSTTKYRIAAPEVYNPETDSSIAMENAGKLAQMYPRSFVAQLGPGKNDWKVCSNGEIIPPLVGLPNPPFPGPGIPPGGADIRGYDPWHYSGDVNCLDVLGALADPNRNVPASNHWTYLTTSLGGSHYSGAAVRMVTINADGTHHQKVYMFGGSSGQGQPNVATAEFIDYSDPAPHFTAMSPLDYATTQNNVVALPDGKLLVVGGGDLRQTHYQLYNTDPPYGHQDVADSPVPRGDHSTSLLVPNGGVWVMGGNRVNILPGQNTDLAYPVMEFYRPPYFFKGPRPVIEDAPKEIKHGKKFNIKVSTPGLPIGSVVLLRTGPISHNYAWSNDYVSLPFTSKNKDKDKDKDKGKGKGKDKDELQVMVSPLPGLAIAGDYMLFAVSEDGIPSVAKHIFLKLDKKDQYGDKHHKDHDKDALKQKNVPSMAKLTAP